MCKIRALRLRFGNAGHRGGHSKCSDDSGTDAVACTRGFPGNHIGDKTAVSIGKVREPNHGRVTRCDVGLLSGVTNRENVGVTRPLRFVHPNSAGVTDSQAGLDRKDVVGNDTDRGHNNIRRDGVPIAELNTRVSDRRRLGSKNKPNLVSREVLLEDFDDFRIELRKNLILHLHHGHGVTCVDKVLCDFDTNEAGAENDHVLFGAGVYGIGDSVGIGNVSECQCAIEPRDI